MSRDSLAGALASLQFTASLPTNVREPLAAIAHERSFAAGDVLCREGRFADELALIVSGRVGLDLLVPRRGQVRVLTLGAGELVAWSAVIDDQEATATAVAIEDTRTISIPAGDLNELCRTNRHVGYVVMRELAKVISRRLVATRLQLLDFYADEST